MAEVTIAAGLGWDEGSGAAVVRAEGVDLLRFEVDGSRLRVALLLVPGHPGIDVSFQPVTPVHLLRARAVLAGQDPHGWEAAVLRRVERLAGTHALWRPARPLPGVGVLGGLAHPLLGRLYDHGVTPVDEVPRWAVPVLREQSLRRGATVAFGAAATRRVVRALGASLLPDAAAGLPPALYPLAAVLAGAGVVPADHLAAVLEEPGPWRAPAVWPSVDDLAVARRVVRRLGPDRATTVLRDGITAPAPALFPTFGLVLLAGRRLDDPLPGRLARLRDACRAVVPVDAGPPPRPAPRPAGIRDPSAPAVALRAPSAPARATGVDRFTYPVTVARLHGHHLDDLRLVLPRTTDDLGRWAATLHNCLDTFADAVVAGRALLVGVEHRDRLVACVEVEPRHGHIRQFLGDRNRPLPDRVTRPVIRTLVERGVVRAPAAN